MRLPAQERKPDNERNRKRQTVPAINGNLTDTGIKNGEMDGEPMIKQDKVANFSHHKRVADYLLGRSVGEGSFAKVRLGLHVQTAEEVAIKVISKARARKDAYVHKNLRREGKILQLARHKNIVQVYDILETDNNYYLVTELCKGGELIDIVTDKGCLPENDVRRYISQLVSAVAHLHRHGIVHRDLKVENLLLDDRGDLKIIDFGLSNVISKTCEDPTRALVTQCGSPAYAAPELLAKNMYGPKVDIWSIGVITYALLVGKLPFTVEPFRIPKLCRKMFMGDMNPIPPHLSGSCRHFILQLLVPNPNNRPNISEVMRISWISFTSRASKASSFGSSRDEIYSATDIDMEVVHEMSSRPEFEFLNVLNCVRRNRPGEALTTYFLLLKQKSQSRDSGIDRRHDDAIGSDGNLDRENESDKSSDEEGLNDIDDITDDVIFNGTFKSRDLYKTPPIRRNGVVENIRTDSPRSEKLIMDRLIGNDFSENFLKDQDKSLKNHKNNSPKGFDIKMPSSTPQNNSSSTVYKSTNDKPKSNTDGTIECAETIKTRFENRFVQREIDRQEASGKENFDVIAPADSVSDGSSSKLPNLNSDSRNKGSKAERKSKGPTSMRELMKTMSRAKDVLQRRSIFGPAKSNRTNQKKDDGSPELNKFRRLLSRNSNDCTQACDRKAVSPTKAGQLFQTEQNVWRNYGPNTSRPMRIKLPEASPPATPMIVHARAISPLPANGYCTKPRAHRTTHYHNGRQSLTQRTPSSLNRVSLDRSIVQDRPFPRIPSSQNNRLFQNPPVDNNNLTPLYHFPSPPRTFSSRYGTGNSGVKEIIEQFRSLTSNGDQPQDDVTQQHSLQRSSTSTKSRGNSTVALSYLSANRRKREASSIPKTISPNDAHVPRYANNGTYAKQHHLASANNYYVAKQNNGVFASHFAGDQQAIKPLERQRTAAESLETRRSPSRGIWYKSAV